MCWYSYQKAPVWRLWLSWVCTILRWPLFLSPLAEQLVFLSLRLLWILWFIFFHIPTPKVEPWYKSTFVRSTFQVHKRSDIQGVKKREFKRQKANKKKSKGVILKLTQWFWTNCGGIHQPTANSGKALCCCYHHCLERYGQRFVT